MEIRRKIIQEQKLLKVKKDNQKRILTNEMKRKYSESQAERHARLALDKANGVKSRRIGGGVDRGEAAVDTNIVIR